MATGSAEADERVEDSFPPRFFELDFELVAFDGVDDAVAEFAVEDALADIEVVAGLVGEGDGGRVRLARVPRLRSGRTEGDRARP